MVSMSTGVTDKELDEAIEGVSTALEETAP